VIKIDEQIGEITGALYGDGCISEYMSITSQQDVRKFFEVFSINHEYHLRRYALIKNTPAPPKATGS